MKKLRLNEYIVKPYEKKYFEEIIDLFYIFNQSAKIPEYNGMFEYDNEEEQKEHLRGCFNQLLEETEGTFLIVDTSNDKVFGYTSYGPDNGEINLTLAFTSPLYVFWTGIRAYQKLINTICIFKHVDRVVSKVYRDRVGKYMDFLHRYFKIEVEDCTDGPGYQVTMYKN
mgnify:FL=1|jgi:hypothetical protein|tara:strand:- start:1969 stop:2475 length:507 start_codon:yes stop_codon:yes gene_type:complete